MMNEPSDLSSPAAAAAAPARPSDTDANAKSSSSAVATIPTKSNERQDDVRSNAFAAPRLVGMTNDPSTNGTTASASASAAGPVRPPRHSGDWPRLQPKEKSVVTGIIRGPVATRSTSTSTTGDNSNHTPNPDGSTDERRNMMDNEKTVRAGSFRRNMGQQQHNRTVSWSDANLADLFAKPATTAPLATGHSGASTNAKAATATVTTQNEAASAPVATGGATSEHSVPTFASTPASPGLGSVPPGMSSDLSFSSASASAQNDSSWTSPHSRRKLARTATRKSRRRLDVGDVIDPIELEAETYILKMLDERDPTMPSTSRSRAGTADYSLLSGVPNEIGHDFDYVVPPSVPKPNPAHIKSKDPVIQAAAKLTAASADKKAHKRSLTVEQTIFGLSSALAAIHGTTALDRDEYVRNETYNDPSLEDPAAAVASTDRLARNVNILFNRTRANTSGGNSTGAANNGGAAKTEKETSPQKHDHNQNGVERPTLVTGNGHNRTASSNWGILKGSLGNYKKDEDSLKQAEDLEAGIEKGDKALFGPTEDVGGASEGNKEDDSQDVASHERRRHRNPFRHLPHGDLIREEWEIVNNFLKPRRSSIFLYMKIVFGYLMIPLISIAAILFYFVDNPPTGRGRVYENNTTASASWWLLFVARNLVTFTLAKVSELVVVDFLSLQTTFALRIFGPLITLLIVQSKGWPFLLSAWSVFDFALLVGGHPFMNHWLYWQGFIDLFNRENPGGDVTENDWFFRILIIALVVGIAVSIKRLVVGLYLGRKTFSNYSKQLARVMNKMLLISEVSAAAKDIEKRSWQMEREMRDDPNSVRRSTDASTPRISNENLTGLVATADDEDDADTATNGYHTIKSQASSLGALERIIDSNTGQLSSSQRVRITQLLGQWEEPARGNYQPSDVPISAVLQFRRALAHMDTDFPFSPGFGLADTRETCVASAQEVFLRLLLQTPESDGVVPFETIATVALLKNGELDLEKVKDLIRVFRPDRDGSLALIDFVRSVDSVYKELRLLRATVVASSKIDEALENIMNIVFYGVMITIILSQLGFNPLSLFFSLSSVIVAFAFMISSASAKYFEGVLFILVQRPYGIGDRINVSNPESEANNGGAQGWIVEDVTLFTTSVVLAATNERATISNGSLAKSRIINGARSPKAVLFFTLKFGLEVPYEKIEIFKSAVEKFVKARPREWLSLLGFRANRVEADLGFIEYIVVLNHRERWQNIAALLQSKAILQSFCLELQKKMDMRYHSPPLPVDLKMVGNLGLSQQLFNDPDGHAVDKQRSASDDVDPTSAAYAGMMEEELNMVAAMFDGQ